MSFYVGLPTDKPAYQRARRAISIPQLLTARQNQRDPLKFWETSLTISDGSRPGSSQDISIETEVLG